MKKIDKVTYLYHFVEDFWYNKIFISLGKQIPIIISVFWSWNYLNDKPKKFIYQFKIKNQSSKMMNIGKYYVSIYKKNSFY